MQTDDAAGIRPHRLPTLTGMRFAAALIVFLCHSSLMGFFADQRLNQAFFGAVSRVGYAGVEFFFILSGFVLAWSARENDTLRAFWRRRAAKIVPNNTVTWLAALAAIWLSGGAIGLWPSVANLLLVQTWWPNMDVFNGVNPPSWSLCCEALFYAAFPFVFERVRRLGVTGLWTLAGLLTGAVLLLPLVAMTLPEKPIFTFMDVPFPQMWFVYGFPLSRMLDFTLGIVLARLVAQGAWPRWSLVHVVPLLAVGYVATLTAPLLFSMAATMIIPLAALVATGASVDVHGGRSPFRSRPVIWLGEISFAFYLIHALVLLYGTRLLPQASWSTPAALVVIAGVFLVVLALSAALYHGVERPLTSRLGRPRRRAPRGRADEAPIAPASVPADVA